MVKVHSPQHCADINCSTWKPRTVTVNPKIHTICSVVLESHGQQLQCHNSVDPPACITTYKATCTALLLSTALAASTAPEVQCSAFVITVQEKKHANLQDERKIIFLKNTDLDNVLERYPRGVVVLQPQHAC